MADVHDQGQWTHSRFTSFGICRGRLILTACCVHRGEDLHSTPGRYQHVLAAAKSDQKSPDEALPSIIRLEPQTVVDLLNLLLSQRTNKPAKEHDCGNQSCCRESDNEGNLT